MKTNRKYVGIAVVVLICAACLLIILGTQNKRALIAETEKPHQTAGGLQTDALRIIDLYRENIDLEEEELVPFAASAKDVIYATYGIAVPDDCYIQEVSYSESDDFLYIIFTNLDDDYFRKLKELDPEYYFVAFEDIDLEHGTGNLHTSYISGKRFESLIPDLKEQAMADFSEILDTTIPDDLDFSTTIHYYNDEFQVSLEWGVSDVRFELLSQTDMILDYYTCAVAYARVSDDFKTGILSSVSKTPVATAFKEGPEETLELDQKICEDLLRETIRSRDCELLEYNAYMADTTLVSYSYMVESNLYDQVEGRFDETYNLIGLSFELKD